MTEVVEQRLHRRIEGRIEQRFAALRERGAAALVVYVTGGDPDLERSIGVMGALERAGVDILELGIPFSDPLADGPVIQAASGRALRAGATVEKLLEMVRRFRGYSELPIVFFTYMNPVYAYGMREFFVASREAGVDGVLVLDLPPEEEEVVLGGDGVEGLRRIRLIAPTTPEGRVRRICRKAEGFVYYVSREGVTGERQELAPGLRERLGFLKKQTKVPVCVGFGISNAEQVRAVAELADGVVVGSAVVRRVEEFGGSEKLEEEVEEFVRPLAEAAHGVQKID